MKLRSYQFLRIVSFLMLICCGSLLDRADAPGADPAARILPERFGSYRALGLARPGGSTDRGERQAGHDQVKKDAQDVNSIGSKNSAAGRMYGSANGKKF